MGATRRMQWGAMAAVMTVALSACAAAASGPTSGTGITVTSTAFAEGATIPAQFTCKGDGAFPGIAWTGVPAGAAGLAVVVDDPDAPSGTFTHLVVVDLPASATGLTDPAEGTVALNSAGSSGWTPPCPPSGTHHYRFTVYALSASPAVAAGATAAQAVAAIQAVATAQGTLTGLVAA